MIYEIAKALKDSGFPQEKRDGSWYGKDSAVFRNGERIEVEECYAPTVGEILALVEGPYFRLEHKTTGWVAQKGIQYPHFGFGKTADEALAQLFTTRPFLAEGI